MAAPSNVTPFRVMMLMLSPKAGFGPERVTAYSERAASQCKVSSVIGFAPSGLFAEPFEAPCKTSPGGRDRPGAEGFHARALRRAVSQTLRCLKADSWRRRCRAKLGVVR
jgi:hypothetical protein